MSKEFRVLARIACLLFVGLPAIVAAAQSPSSRAITAVQATTPPPALAPTSPPPVAPSTPAASVVGADYIIGSGDILQVFVWQNPELTISIPVRGDGKITTPLVEDMTAFGKTPTQLARDIETVLGEYVRSPQVNVLVTQSANANSQVKVMGAVMRQQAVAFREGMAVLDAILEAGGLSQFARGNDTKLFRNENGRQTETRVRVNKLLDGDMTQNLKLKPGDILLVPESRW
jgi:polysaccharide export outer membrane protein